MFYDGVMESSATVGLGDYALAGAVYQGQTFGVFANGDPVCYIAQTLDRSKFEIVIGVYHTGSPRTLTRVTVLQSSAGGAKIDWQAGDTYYLASFASATAVAGLIKGNWDTALPWWVQFGRWIKKNFPTTGQHTEYFYDGANQIAMAVIDTARHTYQSRFMSAGKIIPVGYDTAVAADGELLCDGASYLRADYPLLYSKIGTKFGSVDGTHFNVPNVKGRFLVGFEATPSLITTVDVTAIGKVAGVENESVNLGTGITATVSGSTSAESGDFSFGTGGGSGATVPAQNHTHGAGTLAVAISGTKTVSHLPPLLAVNYVITTGEVS